MTDPLATVRELTAARAEIQSAWAAAVREAVKTHTLAEVGEAAGLTRGRISQIVGPTGRSPGRRKPQPNEAAMQAELDALDARWESFIDKLKDRYALAEQDRKVEQAYRNVENGRAKRQAAGRTRAGNLSGASGWKSTVRPTVTHEVRRFAETFALRYLEQNSTHPVCIKILRELDRAAALRETLAAVRDARVPFLHD